MELGSEGVELLVSCDMGCLAMAVWPNVSWESLPKLSSIWANGMMLKPSPANRGLRITEPSHVGTDGSLARMTGPVTSRDVKHAGPMADRSGIMLVSFQIRPSGVTLVLSKRDPSSWKINRGKD